jgi:hypothetical protein
MEAFLAALIAFPTVCFTGLVGLMLFYWLSVIMGALDIDFLSPAPGHADIGADAHVDSDVGISGHAPHGIHNFISLGKVPVTIIFSAFTFVGWLLCMVGEMLLRGPISSVAGDIVYGLAITPAVLVLAFFITGVVVRPLRGMFSLVTEHAGTSLHGRMVRITSRSANSTFGTAICDNAGAGIIMNVVCRDGITIKRDEMAVVVEYDAAKQTYLVAPFSHMPMDVVDTAVPPPTPAQPVSLERREEPPH